MLKMLRLQNITKAIEDASRILFCRKFVLPSWNHLQIRSPFIIFILDCMFSKNVSQFASVLPKEGRYIVEMMDVPINFSLGQIYILYDNHESSLVSVYVY